MQRLLNKLPKIYYILWGCGYLRLSWLDSMGDRRNQVACENKLTKKRSSTLRRKFGYRSAGILPAQAGSLHYEWYMDFCLGLLVKMFPGRVGKLLHSLDQSSR